MDKGVSNLDLNAQIVDKFENDGERNLNQEQDASPEDDVEDVENTKTYNLRSKRNPIDGEKLPLKSAQRGAVKKAFDTRRLETIYEDPILKKGKTLLTSTSKQRRRISISSGLTASAKKKKLRKLKAKMLRSKNKIHLNPAKSKKAKTRK